MADPDKDTLPLRLKPVVFVDTETSGLSDNPFAEVLELAVVDIEGAVLIDTKVRPVRLDEALNFDADGVKIALDINGYDTELWKEAPTFADLVPLVAQVFEHKVIVGHNPHFDRGFILRGLEHAGVQKAYKMLSRHVIDTTTLAWEHLVPRGLDRLNLDAVCKWLDIPLDREKRHGALADAQACRAAYLAMLQRG